ncbi:MAG: dephospho-CoA kinase [Phycisphaerae bacterium]|nr:dephospho-CoA kinase [Phycisphaerae bacterium]
MSEPTISKPVIGLVGGIGSGKSTVAAEFAALGCAVVDGDAIGHQLLTESAIRRKIQDRWGEAVLCPDGEVNRAALGQIVFQDPDQLEALNRILHPGIRAGIAAGIAAAQDETSVAAVVVDAAVLFEAGWDELCTHTLFVEAAQPLRLARALAQRHWDRGAFEAREKSQISLDTKARKCDYTIGNNSTVPRLREQIRQLFYQIIHVADRP